jgi:hypothetical protein
MNFEIKKNECSATGPLGPLAAPLSPLGSQPPSLVAAVPTPCTAAACSHLPLSCSLPSLLYLSSPLLHPSAQDARAQAEPRTQADSRT